MKNQTIGKVFEKSYLNADSLFHGWQLNLCLQKKLIETEKKKDEIETRFKF